MDFTKLNFPEAGEYSSDEGPFPVEFFLTVLPYSKEIYLKLGYFSSSAIEVLALGFAQFVANGGVMHIATNHFIFNRDLELLEGNIEKDLESSYSLKDPEWIYEQLTGESKHFLDCLKVLANADRLRIVPVMLRPARMVHYKEGVFVDNLGNKIAFTGSCNFTSAGLTENAESISIFRSWLSSPDNAKCDNKLDSISEITNRKNLKYIYLSPEDVLDASLNLGEEKSVDDLLKQELDLLRKDSYKFSDLFSKYEEDLLKSIEEYKISPRFPYLSGPRAYQVEAYKEWRKNDCSGIFAMATGTGKTITSLNCLLNIYQESSVYQAVILVPTKALVLQWMKEVSSFNFRNVILAYSGNSKWKEEFSLLSTSISFNSSYSFIIVSTYDTFSNDFLLRYISKLPKKTLLIADEAHNFGRESIKRNVHLFPFQRRLALSATPKRRFDEEGDRLIEDYFKDEEPYVYSFSMERAIDEGVLTPYKYYPYLVEMTTEEMDLYAEISIKLSKIFDRKSGAFFNPELAKILLLERSRIIHKAVNKLSAFSKIIEELEENNKATYCFVYTPEGNNQEGDNILSEYMDVFNSKAPNRTAHHYTAETENRDQVMLHFEKNNIDALFSMKCLDEGVDIPRAEVAIFCSSTGNPRQFIQRRGRVLRRHPEKNLATIYDLIVIPDASGMSGVDHLLEKKLITDELTRLVYFASLSNNYYEVMNSFALLAEKYDINLFAMQSEIMEKGNGQ